MIDRNLAWTATFEGGEGDDIVYGSVVRSTFHGGDGADRVEVGMDERASANTSNAFFYGEEGDDHLNELSGSASGRGGPDFDELTTYTSGTCTNVELGCLDGSLTIVVDALGIGHVHDFVITSDVPGYASMTLDDDNFSVPQRNAR